MTPSVLIVTPTFNGIRFIEDTIDSVRNQTYTNWTMVIVDDASTDNTSYRLQRYVDEDHRIRVIQRHRNSGRPATPRNEAIRFAIENEIAFDFICFLDDDDLWLPRKLQIQIARMAEKPEIGFLHSRLVPYLTDKSVHYAHRKHVTSIGQFLIYNHISASSVMLRRSEVEKFFPLFDEDIHLKSVEDAELWARLLANQVPTDTTDIEIHRYRVVPGSLSDIKHGSKLRRIFFLYARIAIKNPQIPLLQMVSATVIKLLKYAVEEYFFKIKFLGESTRISAIRKTARAQ